MIGPSPDAVHPMPAFPQVVFLKPLITRPSIEVGEFTYYDDPTHAAEFQDRNVLYHFDFIGDRLIIGRFCALATGVQFMMNGANHDMTGLSTYPFSAFGNGWESGVELSSFQNGSRGDTTVGNDVWLGRDSLVMPGVHIGNGAVVAARAVVTRDVPAFSVVAGNPARIVRSRFAPEIVIQLETIAWWLWDAKTIGRNLNALRRGDIAALDVN